MKTSHLLIRLVLLSFLLTSCGGGPKAVSPVTGLPGGTGDFPWWNDAVFYEIFVRSFYDSDGDGIGDFKGLTEKLDYLNDGDPKTTNDLGVHGVWLMPIFPSPSYHGYDVTDYYEVNPQYGSLDDFKALLAAAHERGIKIIIDLVLNHTSAQHPWFLESKNPDSPYRDWYVWSETDPDYIGPWGQSVWHRSASGYYYAVFWDQMPDLNHENPEVQKEVQKITQFWLEEVGVDGFRMDGARYMVAEGDQQADTPANHAWYAGFQNLTDDIKPDSLLLGEVWTSSYAVAPYIKNDEMDLAFEFDLASALVSSASGERNTAVYNQMKISMNMFPQGQFAPFLTNHDQNRAMTEFVGKVHNAKIAAAMLLTSPGVPFLYYGEEIGMTGGKPDELIRTPMHWTGEENGGFTSGRPWERVNKDYPEKNVAIQSEDPDSLLSLYRKLIQVRNQHEALRIGETYIVQPDTNSIFSLLRSSSGETILVVVNLTEESVSEYALELDEGPLSGAYSLLPVMGEGEFASLEAGEDGGFQGYQPVSSLEPGQILILQLRSK